MMEAAAFLVGSVIAAGCSVAGFAAGYQITGWAGAALALGAAALALAEYRDDKRGRG